MKIKKVKKIMSRGEWNHLAVVGSVNDFKVYLQGCIVKISSRRKLFKILGIKINKMHRNTSSSWVKKSKGNEQS